MDRGIRNTLFGIAAFISLALGLLMASVMMPKPMTIEEQNRLGMRLFEQPREIRDFSLVDYNGEAVGIDNLKGQWSLVFFGFVSCPDICPTTMSVLRDAMNTLPVKPQVVMVSVDPDRDTPEILQQFVPTFHPDFEAFTGTIPETAGFSQQVNVGFMKVPDPNNPGSYTVDHGGNLVLIDPEGNYAGYIKAPHNPENIKAIVRRLIPQST